MEESYEDALEELKRSEHLYYVSLKYTRTVDVIRSLMDRFILMYDHGFNCILKYAKDNKKIDEIPGTPIGRAQTLQKDPMYEELGLDEYTDLYMYMRKMMRLPHAKREEYRRHVTMIVESGEEKEEINIDILGEWYQMALVFMKKVKKLIAEEE